MNLLKKIRNTGLIGLTSLVAACATGPRLPGADIASKYTALGFNTEEAVILYDHGISVEDAKGLTELNNRYGVKVGGYELISLIEKGYTLQDIREITRRTNADEGLDK